MSELHLKLQENLLNSIKSKAIELKPHTSETDAISSFLQDLFIRVFMDLQPHDLIYAATANDENSELQPFLLNMEINDLKSFIAVLKHQNLSGYENNLIELRKRLFRSFMSIEKILSAEPKITSGAL